MKTGSKINLALDLNSVKTYFFYKGDWYHHLREFPGTLVDLNGFVRFETEADYLNTTNLVHGKRLHIKEGIKSLENYIYFNEEQLYIVNQIVRFSPTVEYISDNKGQAERKSRNVDSINRNQSLVRKVKEIRDNRCQICNLKLKIGPNSYYSEVHHIKPLGAPHHGPDVIENMLCLYPNCHSKLDYGFLPIETEFKNFPMHFVDVIFVEYHNKNVRVYMGLKD